MNERRTTLKDIARQLNLSVSAVSKGLHNDLSISPTQRLRIQKSAVSLGYRPDPGLSALAAYRHKSGVRPDFATLAFIGFTPLDHSRTDSFFHGGRHRAEQLGYQLTYYYLSSTLSLERHGQILQSQGLRGLIVAPLPAGWTTVQLDWSQFCVVTIGRSLVEPALHRAAPDEYEALLLAVEKLLQSHHKKIGIAITHEQNLRVASTWSAAAAVVQKMLQAASRRIVVFEDSSGQPDPFLSWFEREKLDVIISLQHPIPDWLRSAGYLIPDDVTISVLDHDPGTKCSGIEQNFTAVGATAMDLLHASLLRGETGIPRLRQTVMVQPEWIEQR